MTDEERPLRLILDTSAMLAFTKDSVQVGELMSLVAEEGGVVGLPVPCLVEARCAAEETYSSIFWSRIRQPQSFRRRPIGGLSLKFTVWSGGWMPRPRC